MLTLTTVFVNGYLSDLRSNMSTKYHGMTGMRPESGELIEMSHSNFTGSLYTSSWTNQTKAGGSYKSTLEHSWIGWSFNLRALRLPLFLSNHSIRLLLLIAAPPHCCLNKLNQQFQPGSISNGYPSSNLRDHKNANLVLNPSLLYLHLLVSK